MFPLVCPFLSMPCMPCCYCKILLQYYKAMNSYDDPPYDNDSESSSIYSGIPKIPGVNVPGVPNLYAGMLGPMGLPHVAMPPQ